MCLTFEHITTQLTMKHTELLFIYGTLLPGLRLERAMDGAQHLGPAKVKGRLYDIGSYPGLVEGEDLVAGEIYRLDPQHLRRLDEVEEMVADDQDASLFWRVRIQIASGAHATQWVWCYRYNRSVKGLRAVTQGDYRAYLSLCR